MNNRRKVVMALGACALAAPLDLFAQGQGKVWRIGFLGSETATGWAKELDVFREGLKDFGYVEDRNVIVVYRWAEGAYERLPQLAAELLTEKPDVFVTYGLLCVRAAQHATTTVPIVIAAMAGNPVSLGFVKSLPVPAGTSLRRSQ